MRSRTCLDSYLYSLTQEVFPYLWSHMFFFLGAKNCQTFLYQYMYIVYISNTIFYFSAKLKSYTDLITNEPKNGIQEWVREKNSRQYEIEISSTCTIFKHLKKRSRICTTVVLQYNLGIIFLFGLCLWCENKVFLLRDMTLISTVKFLSNFIAMLG